MPKNFNRLTVYLILAYYNRKKIITINILKLIFAGHINVENIMAEHVLNENVNTVDFSTLTCNSIKDPLNLDNLPKVTSGVLNTKKYFASTKLNYKENKTNILGSCRIAKKGELKNAFTSLPFSKIKKRKPYFYRFTFLLFYIAAFALWQLFSPVILARLSLLISIFGLSIKKYVLQDKHILAKYVVPILKVFTKSRICCRILLSCTNFKTYLFTHDNQKMVRAIIRASKLIVYFGWAVRTPLILKYYVPFAGLILLVLAVNGVFRAVINLGILLTSEDNLIKQLLQGLTRQINKIPHAAPQNTPRSPEEPNNNNDENKKIPKKKKKKVDRGFRNLIYNTIQ